MWIYFHFADTSNISSNYIAQDSISLLLGINFITVQIPWKTGSLLTIIYCLASPVGGGIGTGLVASDSETAGVTLLNAILSALATGTFLYVGFVEVISYELANIDKNIQGTDCC